jgi:DNA-binding MarR family transcriptional regulator
MQTIDDTASTIREDASKLADFIMFTQRSFLLNLSRELNKGNVSFAQFFLLGYLANESFLTMTDISRKMGHSTAAATGLVDRLEKLGYVQRLHASEDRRKVMVQITEKGVELVGRIREDIVGNLVDLMVDLDQGEQDALLATYGKISTFVRSNCAGLGWGEGRLGENFATAGGGIACARGERGFVGE